MSMYLLLAAPAQSVGEGLTIGEIVSDLPVDPASVFTILLLFGSLAAVLYFGNRGNTRGGGTV